MQLGSLGAGNHYTEVQVVDEIFDEAGAKALGLDRVGQVHTPLLLLLSSLSPSSPSLLLSPTPSQLL